MTNMDYIKSQMPIPFQRRVASGDWECEKCMARDLCVEQYPSGTSEEDCEKVVDMWLDNERFEG